jgi:hypothetical protein
MTSLAEQKILAAKGKKCWGSGIKKFLDHAGLSSVEKTFSEGESYLKEKLLIKRRYLDIDATEMTGDAKRMPMPTKQLKRYHVFAKQMGFARSNKGCQLERMQALSAFPLNCVYALPIENNITLPIENVEMPSRTALQERLEDLLVRADDDECLEDLRRHRGALVAEDVAGN